MYFGKRRRLNELQKHRFLSSQVLLNYQVSLSFWIKIKPKTAKPIVILNRLWIENRKKCIL